MEEDLSHELLQFVDRVQWTSLLKSSHWMSGRHASLKKGRSPEFKEYRHHRFGEDVKVVDWKASSRSRHRLVRECDHQGLLNHWIILDDSASMLFPDGKDQKAQRQKLLCGVLLYWIQAMGDRSSVVARVEGTYRIQTPSRGQDALNLKIGALSDLVMSETIDYDTLSKKMAPLLGRSSVIWMLSDFNDNSEALMAWSEAWRSMGHEVRLMHLFHPTEMDLGGLGLTIFEDLEKQLDEQPLDVDEIREGYIKEMQTHLTSIRQRAKMASIPLSSIDVTQSPEDWLAELLSDSGMHGSHGL